MKISNMSVELIDSMGSDLTVANSARVSFDRYSESFSERDEELISYLARHKHWTPFAHCFATFRVKMPIFVARQLIRHTVGLTVNEVSRRYVDDEPEFYMPSKWRARVPNLKQGSSMTDTIEDVDDIARDAMLKSLDAYMTLIDNDVAPEMARIVLPLNTMTQWIWSGSMYAFARMCGLRLKPDAQAEARMIATEVSRLMRSRFPYSWHALTTGQVWEIVNGADNVQQL